MEKIVKCPYCNSEILYNFDLTCNKKYGQKFIKCNDFECEKGFVITYEIKIDVSTTKVEK